MKVKGQRERFRPKDRLRKCGGCGIKTKRDEKRMSLFQGYLCSRCATLTPLLDSLAEGLARFFRPIIEAAAPRPKPQEREGELTRLARHVATERDRAPHRERLRWHLGQQIKREGAVTVTREFLEEAFPRPDMTENFMLASGGCRPIGTIREQAESWCSSNGFELRECPSQYAQTFTIVRIR
jgi:hypothetical protein